MRCPSNCGLAVLALLAGFGCNDDPSMPAKGSDGGGGRASDASTGSGGAGGSEPSAEDACDCNGETEMRGIATVVSLECACALTGCKPHAHPSEIESAIDCERGVPQFAHVEHGCGFISVQTASGMSLTGTVYRESDHELVGAFMSDDFGSSACGAVFTTDNADLTQCDDYSICDPCPGGANDRCDDTADADAGM